MKPVFILSAFVLVLSVLFMILMKSMKETYVDDAPATKSQLQQQNWAATDLGLEGGSPFRKCDPSCCNAPNVSAGMSCDRGCVCLSQQEQQLLLTRGGNRTQTELF